MFRRRVLRAWGAKKRGAGEVNYVPMVGRVTGVHGDMKKGSEGNRILRRP